MKPNQHILYGLIVSFIIWYIFPSIQWYGALIIWLSSVLIDIDHYLFFVITRKDVNLKRAYLFFLDAHDELVVSQIKHKIYDVPLCFLHTFEAVVVMTVLSFYYSTALYVFIGFIMHYILDAYVTLYQHRLPQERRYTIFWYVLEHI